MSEPILKMSIEQPVRTEPPKGPETDDKPKWEMPEMQDVSQEVMAQPYIRFT
jgi:hypothetical protein